jgi:hypothetical protein
LKRFLNGWRRLGICLTAIWLSLVLVLAISQYTSHAKGFFVYWSLPVGTRVGGSKATLRDGKVVTIDDTNPATGKKLEPWQIDWDHQPNVPSVPQILWFRLALFVVIIPLALWILVELVTKACRWIRAGFHPPSVTP